MTWAREHLQAIGRNGGEVNGPVFYDASGVRVIAMQWTGRTACLLGALVCLAVAATLGTHVSLPGLDQLSSYATLSERTLASRSAERPAGIEPLLRPVGNEDTGRIGTERPLVVAPKSSSPAARRTRAGIEGSGTTWIGRADKVSGITPAKTHKTPAATPASPNPIAQQPPGRAARRHAGESKANQAKDHGHVRGPAPHSESRAVVAESHAGAKARSRSAKPPETPKPSNHSSTVANVKP